MWMRIFVAGALAMSVAPLAQQRPLTASSTVAALREPRDRASVDATARMLTTGTARSRSVVKIRIRSQLLDGVYKMLIEQLDAGASAGRMLVERDTRSGRVTVHDLALRTPSPDPSWPPGRIVPWLSACLTAEDLSDAHLWWPEHTIDRRAVLNGRPVVVLTSRPGDATAWRYTRVTSWIDAERLVPLQAEKTLAGDRGILRVTYDRFREREDHWLPGRVKYAITGCDVEMTVLSGTTRARIDPAIFARTRGR